MIRVIFATEPPPKALVAVQWAGIAPGRTWLQVAERSSAAIGTIFLLIYAGAQIEKGAPLAVPRFADLHVRVPVFEGTDYLTLSRGVGWISGTARPREPGNTIELLATAGEAPQRFIVHAVLDSQARDLIVRN